MTEEEFLLGLGKRIASYRKKKKLSQLALSIESGIAKSYISELEKGRRNPTVTTLLKLVKPLGVKVSTLMPK